MYINGFIIEKRRPEKGVFFDLKGKIV